MQKIDLVEINSPRMEPSISGLCECKKHTYIQRMPWDEPRYPTTFLPWGPFKRAWPQGLGVTYLRLTSTLSLRM